MSYPQEAYSWHEETDTTIGPLPADLAQPLFAEAAKTGLVGFGKESIEYFGAWDFGSKELVGMAGIRWYRGKAVMKNLYVKPEHRGRGIASALWNRRVEEVRLRGVPFIEGVATAKGLPRWLSLGADVLREYKGDKSGRWTLVRLRV